MKSTFRFWIDQCATQKEWRAAIQAAPPELLDDLARLTWDMWKLTASERRPRESPEDRRRRLKPLIAESRAQVVTRVLKDIRLPDNRKFANVQWFELEELKVTYRSWAGLIEWCQRHVRVNDETVTVGSQIKPKLLLHQVEIRGLFPMQSEAA